MLGIDEHNFLVCRLSLGAIFLFGQVPHIEIFLYVGGSVGTDRACYSQFFSKICVLRMLVNYLYI